MTLVEELRSLALSESADRIEELEKAFLMVARNFAKASARIEELEKQFLARTGQVPKTGAASMPPKETVFLTRTQQRIMHRALRRSLPSVTPELDKETK